MRPGYNLFMAGPEAIAWTVLRASLMPQLVLRIKVVIACV